MVRSNLTNIIFFNAIWFGCVVGRIDWLWATSISVIAYIIALYPSLSRLLSQIAVPATIGILVDSLLVYFNVFIFPASSTWLPLWLVVLWFGFATTLSKSLAFLGKRATFAVAGGAVGFPFSYLMGSKLGAVQLGYDALLVGILLAVIWAVLLPLLFWLVSREAVGHA